MIYDSSAAMVDPAAEPVVETPSSESGSFPSSGSSPSFGWW